MDLCNQLALSFHTTFSDLDLDLGSRQWKAKPVGSLFLLTFQLISMKFDVMLKQCRLKILIVPLSGTG